MPLTRFQGEVAKLLASNRTRESHLAGGAALHFSPRSKRYSNDLDFFHDSVERVVEAFEKDRTTLESNGYVVVVQMEHSGFVRAVVTSGPDSTKLEWSHDSAWRFMPPVYHPSTGFQLHPIDVAINKTLALAGRDEPRDFIDIMFIHERILPFGALCWAAVGKDPGFTPVSLLELLKRRGRYRPEDFSKLMLTEPIDLTEMKTQWLGAVSDAEHLLSTLPPDEIGCLYYSKIQRRFVAPQTPRDTKDEGITPHYGVPGGILPKLYNGDSLAESLNLLTEIK